MNEDDGMIVRFEQICEDYRNADSTKRLDMFMSIPALRNDFLEIDRKDTRSDFHKTMVTSTQDLDRQIT
jgi:hypothetical protein